MVYESVAITGRKKMSKPVKMTNTERAKTSVCVRFDDQNGFACKFNKTGFNCPERRKLYQFFVKCYEQMRRRKLPEIVASKEKFREFRMFLASLKPLPEDFQGKSHEEKQEVLKKLFNELEDDAAAALARERNQDIGMLVNNYEIIPREEGQEADITPDIAHELLYGYSSQNVAMDQPDHPHGRPPPNPCVHPHEFGQCECELGNLELRASKFPDISAKFEKSRDELIEKFRDELIEREISEALKDDSNIHLRIRQKEIYEQLEVELKS